MTEPKPLNWKLEIDIILSELQDGFYTREQATKKIITLIMSAVKWLKQADTNIYIQIQELVVNKYEPEEYRELIRLISRLNAHRKEAFQLKEEK